MKHLKIVFKNVMEFFFHWTSHPTSLRQTTPNGFIIITKQHNTVNIPFIVYHTDSQIINKNVFFYSALMITHPFCNNYQYFTNSCTSTLFLIRGH